MNRVWHVRRAKRELRLARAGKLPCLCHGGRHLLRLPLRRLADLAWLQGVTLELVATVRDVPDA